MPGEIVTLLIAAAPISEIQGAIPVAMGVYGYSPITSYILGVVGNMLPVIPLMLFWQYLYQFLIRYVPATQPFFDWLFERTRRHHGEHFALFGTLGLITFVAVPFPLTGVWASSVAIFLFGIPFWRAFFSLLLGVLIAGLLVLITMLGITVIF